MMSSISAAFSFGSGKGILVKAASKSVYKFTLVAAKLKAAFISVIASGWIVLLS